MEQMCTAVFAFLESARPFFQYGKPLQELLPFFVRALGGILPLDALAIVRMEGKKGVCETACWSGAQHLPEALMLRAVNGKEFPKTFDTPFSEEALAALFPEETAGKFSWLALPIACDADALGLLLVGRESGETEWLDREQDFLRLVCAMLGFFFAGKAHCEQQSFHIGVLNAAMDQVKVGLYVTDPHTDAILYMNKFMKDVFKLEHPEGGICWQVLQSGMNGRCPFCPVDRLMADANQNQVFRWEERNTLTGRIYDNSDSLMRWTDGSLVHLQQSVDITDSLRLHKEANYDELTGLLNRRAGKAALADALVCLDREEASLIVGMFDLDRLKEINDLYGHVEGDRALRTIAQEMQRSLHAPDMCFRLSGDEFVVFAPYFPEYKVFIEGAGAKMVLIPPEIEGFQIDFDAFEAAISEHTKGVVVNSPNNPSGVVYSRETLERLAAILTEKSRAYGHPIYLISDEPYREIVFSGFQVPWIPQLYPDTIVCYSFSKSLSLPGERLGYVLVPKQTTDAISVSAAVAGAGRSLGYVNAPSLFQQVTAECCDLTSDISVYERNCTLLTDALREMGYHVVQPGGAFYLFPRSLEPDDMAFSERAKQFDLLLVPGSGFGAPGHVRIAYCVQTDMIQRALPKFKALADSYR